MESPTYNPDRYPQFAVTVDIAVFTVRERHLWVALVERGREPFEGMWALPGGFVKDESLDDSATRELGEETGLMSAAPHLAQFGAYGDPDRDPRMRVVSIGYWAIAPNLPELVGGGDARTASLLEVSMVLADPSALAFDHHLILSDALAAARGALEVTTVATGFCESEFTISELRDVYQAVWGVELDPGNFQNRILDTEGFVVPTGARRRGGRGRPPELYTAGPATSIEPPLRRPGDR